VSEVSVRSPKALLTRQASGAPEATYGYTPYGASDGALTKVDTDIDSPFNPYRYSAKRLDSGSRTYDMGVRRYDRAAQRFLQLDQFQGALDDLTLATDPLTQNRYSLAASNPLSAIEWDGHVVVAPPSGGAAPRPPPPVTINITSVTIYAPSLGALQKAIGAAYHRSLTTMAYPVGPGQIAHGAPLGCLGGGADPMSCGVGQQAELGVFANDVCQTGHFACTGLDLKSALAWGFQFAGSMIGVPAGSLSRGAAPAESAGRGVEVLFGQRRVSPEFSDEGSFKGRSIYAVAQDINNGRLDPNGVVVHAFWHNGQLIAENSRSLATLSLAGLRPTNIKILDFVPQEVMDRLRDPVLLDRLPSRMTAVTPSKEDLRVGDIIRIPGG
jgi:RHS repeat-associated protein